MNPPQKDQDAKKHKYELSYEKVLLPLEKSLQKYQENQEKRDKPNNISFQIQSKIKELKLKNINPNISESLIDLELRLAEIVSRENNLGGKTYRLAFEELENLQT